MSVFDKLHEEGLLMDAPRFIKNNVIMEVLCGSRSYGTHTLESDYDVCSVCIPQKDMLFPHLNGHIEGFGRPQDVFRLYEKKADYKGQREYELKVYNIAWYFQLIMENNPNMLDTLFVAQDCIMSINAIGQMIREKRRSFLHKGSYYKFIGFAHSQLHKMQSNKREGNRKELYEKFGFDVKYAMNLVRLAYEGEQILAEGDIDLRRYSDHLRAVRRGEIPEKDIREWFASKEKHLEHLYQNSSLPYGPDKEAIRELLMNCLEHHFGSLDKCVQMPNRHENALKEIGAILSKLGM